MHAKTVEDLQVFQRARGFTVAVFAMSGSFGHDRWLAEQLCASAESIMANIGEGFQQRTDRAFARYLVIAAGSAEEARAHLAAAEIRGHISKERVSELSSDAREITKMLGALVRYLHRSNRQERSIG
jgi:four helix bundle protein